MKGPRTSRSGMLVATLTALQTANTGYDLRHL
jgi:hypothetical protein